MHCLHLHSVFNLFSEAEPFAAILIAHGTHAWRAKIRGRRLRAGGVLGGGSSSAKGLGEPQPQVYFGPTKSLENASSGRKCRMQFNFFTEHRRSRRTLGCCCEVAADWYELLILWHIMWPSVAHASEQLLPPSSKCFSTLWHWCQNWSLPKLKFARYNLFALVSHKLHRVWGSQ